MQKINTRRGVLALSPIIVLLTIYLAGSIIAGDFYRIPIVVAFMTASIYAVAITRGTTLDERIDNFSKGAANTRIMYMIWIFVLAGAFASLAKAMGAVDATVQLTLNLIPSNYLPAGIFIAACFISLSIGTSVGTIVALTPVVTALSGWFASLLAGAVFVEYVFDWKGIGVIIVDALDTFDFPVIMGAVLLIGFMLIIINIIVDIIYGILDPRVRVY